MKTFKEEISKRYEVKGFGLDLADKLHQYPDEFWQLASAFYYHHELASIMAAPFDDPRKKLFTENEGLMREIQNKYPQFPSHDLIKEHQKTADSLFQKIEKKWPEVTSEGGLYKALYHSNIRKKFDKWMRDPKVLNPIGEPKVSYLDF